MYRNKLSCDFHALPNPALNVKNFPTFSFEYFKEIDMVGIGSFLLKLQADLKFFWSGYTYPFQWKGAWFATNLLFRYNAFEQPGYDPQIWIRIKNGFSVGSRINVYYHLLSKDDQIQLYPTLGTKYQF